jgi:hypothetical protein
MSADDLLTSVRLAVLQHTIETTIVPEAGSVAGALGLPETTVIDAYRELGQRHVYVVDPQNPRRLRMATPFSAVPTSFRVVARGREYYGNCVWDGLGIVSLLGGEGVVRSHCPDCHQPLALDVVSRRLEKSDGIVHFSVPARHWWDDMIYT